jgi:putative ABC transport system permease protein
MLRNYLTIALRNLWKRRAFSLINICGLSVGMTACFLISLYVRFELSYDRFHRHADRIYRVVCDIKTPTETIRADGPSWPVLPNLINEFPEVESAVRTVESSLLLRKGDIKFQEEHALFADPAFFQIFDFRLVKGDPKTVLKDPFSLVLSESAAKKYFGNTDPIGQTILLAQKAWPVKVTGLMADLPENSQIKADIIVSMSTETLNLNRGLEEEWEWSSYHPICYILVRPNTNAWAMEKRFPAFMDKVEGAEMKKNQQYSSLSLEPLKDVYLKSMRNGNKTANSKNVYLFAIIAAIVILIACINFVNLTTARAAERAKEVGIRKVVGAIQFQLARQFTGESILLSLIAFSLSIVFISLLIPEFNQSSGKMISHGIFEYPQYIFFLFLAALGIGIIAGFYPALVLSSFKPSTVLKGRFASSGQGNMLRKALVLVQFSFSIGFIIAVIVVHNQLSYMRNQDLGFNKDELMIINTEGDPAKLTFQQSLKGIPGVISTSLASSVPGSETYAIDCEIENNRGDLQVANLDSYFVDWDYIDQYQIHMIAGRAFSRQYLTDSTDAMILNETAVKMFGYPNPQAVIGRRFKQIGREGKIIGVIKDFHYRSLQQEINPLAIRIEPDGCFLVSVKVATRNLAITLSAIQDKWKTIIPHRPLLYYFLDEHFDTQYRSDERFGKLFLYFTILAIFISCLGLFGLASYSIIQRTREIAVRKVMGASVENIVRLLSRDFIQLVCVSFLVAAPLAWWTMHRWLTDFAYRTSIGWWDLLEAGIVAAIIALGTISYQAIKAAIANPVKSLKIEG